MKTTNLKNTFLKLIKNVWFWIILIGITISSILFVRCNNSKPTGSGDGTAKTLRPVSERKDKEGNIHAILPTNVVPIAIMDYRLDSLNRYYKGRINQMTTFTGGVDTEFIDRPVYIPVNAPDSFYLDQSDAWFTASAKGSTKTKRGSLKVTTFDTLTYTDITRGVGNPFKANKREIDITNKNPYNKIKMGSSITLKEPKTVITVGPYVGYGVMFANGKPVMAPSIGIAATFNLFSIKSRK